MMHARTLSLLAVGLALFASVSCAGGNTVEKSDLMHRRFVLESVNGKPFENAFRTPDIEFGENFHISGQVCNRYMGQGELAGNILTVKHMASTRMLCPDEDLNNLEHEFSLMLQDGAEVSFSENRLTLTGSGWTLVYKAEDWVR